MKKILTLFFWHFCTGGLAFGVFGHFFNSLSWPMKFGYLMGYTLINALLFLGFKRLTEPKSLPQKPGTNNSL